MIYKCVLIGDGGVGKTTFIKKLLTGKFERIYIPTLGVEEVSQNGIQFNVWDTAGQEKFGNLRDDYYVNADCAIVMYDTTSNISRKNVMYWLRDILRVKPNIPIVIVANKCDIKSGFGDLEISSKTGYNIEEPFLQLARELN